MENIQKKPLVSVIMSTCNTQKNYLKEAIDSIIRQTYKELEFIIVCDGSEKDQEIINEYRDNRIKVIIHTENKGLPFSLNEAIRCSKGKYIARMDSDDIAIRDRLERQVKFLEKNTDIDICSMFVKRFGNENYKDANPYIRDNLIKTQLIFSNIIIHPSVMIRKEFLIKNNLFYDEHFKNSQDYELWCRCKEFGKFAVIPKIGMNYRMHDKQITSNKHQKQFEYYKEVLTKNLKEFKNTDLDKSVEKITTLFMSKDKINKDQFIEISTFIDDLINNNEKYNKKDLETVLYLKIFDKGVKSKLILCNLFEIMLNNQLRKKIFKFSNFSLNLKKIYYKLIS